jgi:hypothetical protein
MFRLYTRHASTTFWRSPASPFSKHIHPTFVLSGHFSFLKMQYKVMEIRDLVRHLYTEIQLDNLCLEGGGT